MKAIVRKEIHLEPKTLKSLDKKAKVEKVSVKKFIEMICEVEAISTLPFKKL